VCEIIVRLFQALATMGNRGLWFGSDRGVCGN